MAIKDWDKTAEGNLKLSALIDWSGGTGPEMALVRLRIVNSLEERQRGDYSFYQLGMTAEQARRLSADLVRLADALDAKKGQAPA